MPPSDLRHRRSGIATMPPSSCCNYRSDKNENEC
jgi:hypothetical protein